MTLFTEVYNRFLGKITDDMYLELTPQDTIQDLRHMLIDAIPGFEFPRKDLYKYSIKTKIKNKEDVEPQDFVIGEVEPEQGPATQVIIEKSSFDEDLTSEEINILAILMLINWVQRQVTSIENTRMKYSGSDFKMTSQANHLSKLLSLLNETKTSSHHMQRLYKRRRFNDDGTIRSNWRILSEYSVLDNKERPY